MENLEIPSINLKFDYKFAKDRLHNFHITKKGAAIIEYALGALSYNKRASRVVTTACCF